ncbi:MAG: hypothetical protein AB1813_03280 [Verrucomicrobiota bacterium]
MMILGGLLGFTIGVGFGLAQSSGWPSILWRASLAAYVGGLLLRWWGRVWARSLQQAHQERFANSGNSSTTPASGKTKL